MTRRSVRAARRSPPKRVFGTSTAEWIEPLDLDDEDEDEEEFDDTFAEPDRYLTEESCR